MPYNPLNETEFERHITEQLASSPLYNERTAQDFDIPTLVDRGMLERFLKNQPQAWQKLSLHFPGRETDAVIAEYNNRINRGDSILRLLHNGLTIKGAKIRFVQFKPELDGPGTANYELYKENCFSVVRQMRYSDSGNDRGNELDLVILINGLPIITFELKNEGTGQCYGDGIYQYRYERNPENRMLRNCLVHFVMDNNVVFMTTKLNGADTRFLPFNQDSVNPPIEGEYPVAYMWQDILQADSLLDILQNFIKRYQEGDKYVTIFPRFHQLRAVRKLRRLVREEGPGHNYLIEHSAGSGKTKSMAWLAHQLVNMTNPDHTPIFDSVIMVTDRIVLNRNMAEDVVNFESVAGTVKDIRRGSKNLAKALDEGHRIIISTVQKFAFALATLKREKARKYAIIIDEAHTAIGNESAKDITNALSTDEDLQKIGDYNPDDYDNQMDALMAYMQVMRRQMGHLSYFAFTATPKDKTFALFGKDGHSSHDLYSMKQAIDEKFILDVLQNYRSYVTMFGLIEKEQEEDEKKLFEEKKSLKLIYGELNHNRYIMLRKAVKVIDHLVKHTIGKIGGHGKAMLVCDSRRAAAEYKQLIDRILKEEYNSQFKTLVAFSGEVEDSHGRRCTEANMNDDHAKDDDIRIKFQDDDYRLLIVAEKFQTGFDQPLLHTMFVDRSLGGIQAIQTLSRLNRCYPGKEDTAVVDFRNDPVEIQAAFQKYYTEITLEGEVDTQRIYTLKDDIEQWNIFNQAEVDAVVNALHISKKTSGVPSMLKKIVEERVKPLDDDKKDLYRKLINRYVRQYGFLAQMMDFTDPDLEKFYIFCKVFYKYLPYTKETLPMEILDRIDLDKLRIQMSFDGMLPLEDEEQTMQSSRIGEPGKKQEDEKRTVAEILNLANSPFADLLDENDKIIRQLLREVAEDPEVNEAMMANNSPEVMKKIIADKFGEKLYAQIEKHINFADLLERERGFSDTLNQMIFEYLVRRSQNKLDTYDEALLKERIVNALKGEFSELCSHMRTFEEFVDHLFFVLNQVSIPSLDGVDELLKNSLNELYVNDNLRTVDKRLYFGSIVTKYEAFLKKLYYLIHDEELTDREGSSANASLSNAIFAFDSLRNLRNSSDDEGRKFSGYLDLLRQCRNEESHNAQNISEAELDAAIQVVTSMYLYATGTSITDLEMNGYDIDSVQEPSGYAIPDFEPLSMAAEDIEIYGNHVEVILKGTSRQQLMTEDLDLVLMYAIGPAARTNTQNAGKLALGLKDENLTEEAIKAYTSAKTIMFHYWKNNEATPFVVTTPIRLVAPDEVPEGYLRRLDPNHDAKHFLLVEYDPSIPANLSETDILKVQRKGRSRYIPFVTKIDSLK